MLVSSTRELIELLQDYERRNGIGAIRSVGTYISGRRDKNFILNIANDSLFNEVDEANASFHIETIETTAVEDDILFANKS